jgi:hypothetical protein
MCGLWENLELKATVEIYYHNVVTSDIPPWLIAGRGLHGLLPRNLN